MILKLKSNQKRLPSPRRLVNANSPPIKSTKRLVIANPNPVPPNRLDVDDSACTKPWKILVSCSLLIPIPVSVTEMVKLTCFSSIVLQRTPTMTWPSAVNLIALPARFNSTWRKRSSSPSIR